MFSLVSLQRICVLIVLLTCIGTSPSIRAASFGVLPIRVYLETQKPIGTITVTNHSDEKVLVQSQAVVWEQIDGKSELTPTNDLIVSPPIFELNGKEDQIVRLGLAKPTKSEIEQSFRILLTEVPTKNRLQSSGVQINLRLSIPVFITPKEAATKLNWKARKSCDSTIRIVAENMGERHSMFLKLDINDLSSSTPFQQIHYPRYLLAGAQTWWDIKNSTSNFPSELVVKAETLTGIVKSAPLKLEKEPC